MKHFASVLKSVVEAEILHVVELDGLQLLAVQEPVAKRHPADKLPAGHHPHHRVIAADLQVSCKRGRSRHSHSGRGWGTRRDGEQRQLTWSGEGDAKVCDGQQLGGIDPIPSQQLHKIPRFCTRWSGSLGEENAGRLPQKLY